jgi:peptidyl-prolyl cis-trans isomerase SurA
MMTAVINKKSHRFAATLGLIAALGSSAACSRQAAGPASADVWAVVDDFQITKADVEKAYRRVNPQAGAKATSSEEELAAKLNLVDELITEEVLVRRARELKIEVTDAEVETAYGERKRNLTDEAFQKELKDRNLAVDDMKLALRRELLADRVIEREVNAKISVTDQEIRDFYERNKAQFNLAESQYRLAQIIITPVKGQVRNRLNDDAGTPEEAKRKADSLMERLKAGSSFAQLAMDYSEDPQSAPRGGDLGFVPMSRLQQVPPSLRNAVLKKTPGTVSLVSQDGSHTIVLVVAHEVAGQRDLSMPAVRENVTGTLRGRREQLLRAAYLTAAQSDAQIVNYLARRLVESQGKIPALGLAGPSGKEEIESRGLLISSSECHPTA